MAARTLIVTNLMLSLGLALGFALPGAPRLPAAAPWRPGLYLIPVSAARFWPARAGQGQGAPQDGFGGLRRGFERIAAPPTTPAVLVQPRDTAADRRQMVVPSELLRQISQSHSFDRKFTLALDYAATNAPVTMLTPRNPYNQQILLGGPELLEHRATDLRVKLTPVNGLLFRVDRWWPDSGQGSAP